MIRKTLTFNRLHLDVLVRRSMFSYTNQKLHLEKIIEENTNRESIKLPFKPETSRKVDSGGLIIFKGKSNMRNRLFILNYCVMLPINCFLLFKLVSNIASFKVINSILLFVTFVLTARIQKGSFHNLNFIVKSIKLKQNGKEVYVETYGSSFRADVKNLRKVKKEEDELIQQMSEKTKVYFIPVIIGNKIYLLPKNCIYSDKELLMAVCAGREIEFSALEIDDKSS